MPSRLRRRRELPSRRRRLQTRLCPVTPHGPAALSRCRRTDPGRRCPVSAREWIEKDFYAELGVSSTASGDDIKRAYRKLARDLHPDANPGDTKAEERFKAISEAHAVLSDPAKRKEYDETRRLFAAGGGFGRGGFSPGGGYG